MSDFVRRHHCAPVRRTRRSALRSWHRDRAIRCTLRLPIAASALTTLCPQRSSRRLSRFVTAHRMHWQSTSTARLAPQSANQSTTSASRCSSGINCKTSITAPSATIQAKSTHTHWRGNANHASRLSAAKAAICITLSPGCIGS